jgi:glycosyltransferase involved in cell wall biosynthesis
LSASAEVTTPQAPSTRPQLTVVVPVYNGGEGIVENIGAIQRAATAALPPNAAEVVVVSDGSIDETAERLLAARDDIGIRVIHYDRNLGKGYAVRAGALASHGEWVALVDADLDVDPASIPTYVEIARRELLDFAIGSKRHPESVVSYPRSRRIASWSYQQLNRVLFRLDVRDTQVGLKVLSRRVVEEIMPLLLVKRYAFDLELLAVAQALGYGRMRELPVRLEYRFTGSGVRSTAALLALWDTFAIFYRLRILRTYERKRRLLGRSVSLGPEDAPAVELIGDAGAAAGLDYPRLETGDDHAQLVALLAPGAKPAGNWISASVLFFADPDVAAVVVPTLAPLRTNLRTRVATAVLESRLGGGSRRSGHFPGNVRAVVDHPGESIVIRRADYRAATEAGIGREEWVAWLASRGRQTIYTPDTSVSISPPPLVAPHLAGTFRHARMRGRSARRTRGRSISGATALSLAPATAAVLGVVLLVSDRSLHAGGVVLILVYVCALLVSALHAALRFRSIVVGALEPFALIATQMTYAAGFVRGLVGLR